MFHMTGLKLFLCLLQLKAMLVVTFVLKHCLVTLVHYFWISFFGDLQKSVYRNSVTAPYIACW